MAKPSHASLPLTVPSVKVLQVSAADFEAVYSSSLPGFRALVRSRGRLWRIYATACPGAGCYCRLVGRRLPDRPRRVQMCCRACGADGMVGITGTRAPVLCSVCGAIQPK